MIEIGDLAYLYNVESGDINENRDHLIQALDMKHANGYTGYSEMFPHSHRFNAHDLPITVHEGNTQTKIGDDRDEKTEKSLDIHRRKYVEHQESYKDNIFATTASEPNYLRLNEIINATEATEERHKCDLCDYSTQYYGSLIQHKLIHTGEKPYKCDICDYRAMQSGDLRIHRRIHTGERPYKCDLCDYRFRSKGTLKEHKLIHSGEKPYKCDLCDYSSIKKGNLNIHKLIHSRERP